MVTTCPLLLTYCFSMPPYHSTYVAEKSLYNILYMLDILRLHICIPLVSTGSSYFSHSLLYQVTKKHTHTYTYTHSYINIDLKGLSIVTSFHIYVYECSDACYWAIWAYSIPYMVKLLQGNTFTVFMAFHSARNLFLWIMALLIGNITESTKLQQQKVTMNRHFIATYILRM